MANVTYKRKRTEPLNNELVFRRQMDGSIISDLVTLGFEILLKPDVDKPIARVQLIFEMLHYGHYEFVNEGAGFEKEFTNVSNGFQIDNVQFRIKILNPSAILDMKVSFRVRVMDFEEMDPYPSGSQNGYYSWKPIPSFKNFT